MDSGHKCSINYFHSDLERRDGNVHFRIDTKNKLIFQPRLEENTTFRFFADIFSSLCTVDTVLQPATRLCTAAVKKTNKRQTFCQMGRNSCQNLGKTVGIVRGGGVLCPQADSTGNIFACTACAYLLAEHARNQ